MPQKTIYNFWTQFSLPVYDSNSVPTGDNAPDFPYITFDSGSDFWGYPQALSASIWYHDSSWARIEAKAEEIKQKIGRGGVMHGKLWITAGQPFIQRSNGDIDPDVKRMYININVENMEE